MGSRNQTQTNIMTTKTTPYLIVSFTREDGHTSHLWASRIECVWGDVDRGEFVGFVCTEYQTGEVWKKKSGKLTLQNFKALSKILCP